MLFNSIEFLIFLPIVIILYYLIPPKYRWIMLLMASYFFYMFWKAEYIILIIISTLIDYLVALKMDKLSEKKDKKKYLSISIFSNLFLLFSFKYFNFFSSSVSDFIHIFNPAYLSPTLKLLLPVGISFYTFQTLSYSIDVYHGRIKAEKHLGIFALYVSFWPQLVAGPIERASHLLPQFRKKISLSFENFVFGFNKIALGFFKKIVIADRLAVYVQNVFDLHFQETDTLSLILAVLFFGIQIYCDFSAYSDIAIGSARLLGIDLMENFRRPYLSKSISEFWRRWHISLSTWFKDYIYIPLGGNRVLKFRWYYNLFITFLLSGLWHGANWTYVVWGALHGFYLVSAIILKPLLNKLESRISILKSNFFNWFLTFSLVMFSWIFFRAKDLAHALAYIKKILEFDFSWHIITISANIGPFNLFLNFFAIFLLLLSYLLPENLKFKHNVLFLVVITFLIIILGYNGNQEFIYFQF